MAYEPIKYLSRSKYPCKFFQIFYFINSNGRYTCITKALKGKKKTKKNLIPLDLLFLIFFNKGCLPIIIKNKNLKETKNSLNYFTNLTPVHTCVEAEEYFLKN